MDEDGLKLLQDLSDVSADARERVLQLQALAEAETLGEQWSSQVTRCQTQISDALKRMNYLMFELEIMVEEEDRPALEMSLKGQQKKYELQKKDINALHTKAKQALSQASARGSQQQRQQLLAGAATPGARGRVGTVDEAVSTSQSITAGLRRTAKMMAEEIDLTQGNLSLVSASTKKLDVASREYEKQHGQLKRSKGLLRVIRWHEKKEDILLYAGLAFFCLCVAYIVFRRSLLFIPALPSFAWLRGGGGSSAGVTAGSGVHAGQGHDRLGPVGGDKEL